MAAGTLQCNLELQLRIRVHITSWQLADLLLLGARISGPRARAWGDPLNTDIQEGFVLAG
jgi:hypothetical protein